MDDKTKIAALTAAIQVLTRTEHIRAYLAVMDPKALEQAETALEVPEFLRTMNSGLPDLRDMQTMLTALRLLADRSASLDREDRHQERLEKLVARVDAGMKPLAEREDKINEEERRKERRKSMMADS